MFCFHSLRVPSFGFPVQSLGFGVQGLGFQGLDRMKGLFLAEIFLRPAVKRWVGHLPACGSLNIQ